MGEAHLFSYRKRTDSHVHNLITRAPRRVMNDNYPIIFGVVPLPGDDEIRFQRNLFALSRATLFGYRTSGALMRRRLSR